MSFLRRSFELFNMWTKKYLTLSFLKMFRAVQKSFCLGSPLLRLRDLWLSPARCAECLAKIASCRKACPSVDANENPSKVWWIFSYNVACNALTSTRSLPNLQILDTTFFLFLTKYFDNFFYFENFSSKKIKVTNNGS